MEATGFPTSADIYLELDGRKIAVVQGYTARASKSSQSVEAFGESEPVATIEGQKQYTLELTRCWRSGGGPGSWQRSPWNAPCCATPRCWQRAACARGSRCSPTARRSWSG